MRKTCYYNNNFLQICHEASVRRKIDVFPNKYVFDAQLVIQRL